MNLPEIYDCAIGFRQQVDLPVVRNETYWDCDRIAIKLDVFLNNLLTKFLTKQLAYNVLPVSFSNTDFQVQSSGR